MKNKTTSENNATGNLHKPLVSGMLSPIVPTEIRIREKARKEYGTPPGTDGEEVAFVEGARWMKKILLGDNCT